MVRSAHSQSPGGSVHRVATERDSRERPSLELEQSTRQMACSLFRAHAWLILWMLLIITLFITSYQKYLKPQYYYLHKMLGAGLCVSRASASVINLCSALVLLPVCKYLNSFIYQYLNKVSRSLLTFWLINLKNVHITFALTIVIASVIHSCAHFVNAVNFSRHYNSRYQEINWAKYKGQSPILLVMTSTSGLTGMGMLFILILMLLMSLNIVREHLFDLFWATHILFIPFMGLLILHPLSGVLKEQSNFQQTFNCSKVLTNETASWENLNCFSNPIFSPMKCQGWLWVVAGLAVFSLDFTLRLCLRNHFSYTVQKNVPLPGEVSQLTLATKRKVLFKPGQYILLQYPRLSVLEWHPFTVTSVQMSYCHTSITLLIRKRGDWTRKACKMLSNPGHDRISLYYEEPSRLLVDGPFSSPMENILKMRVAVCIAAGIGITPFIATLNSMYTGNHMKENLCRLHLVWVVRSRNQLVWAADLITALHHKFWNASQPDRFQFALYITRHDRKDTTITQLSPLCQSLLEQRTHLGRPKWEELFSEWISLYYRRKVTLFVCGPNPFSEDIQKTARRFNDRGHNFNCIKESFS